MIPYLVSFAVPAVLLIGLTLALLPDIRWSIRARRPAEQRGIAILRSWLTPEQAKQWDTCGEFDVIGGETGRRYRIARGTAMNIRQLDPVGHTIAQWCFAPEGKLATGDVLLAQKIALETMESQALALANTQTSRSTSSPRR
jgi:hypothetical protein